MKALVCVPVCPLMSRPAKQSGRADEVLHGMAVELLEDTRTGWYLVRTHYGYTGYAPAEGLLFGDSSLARWTALPKRVVTRGICDVLAAPAVESWCVETLVRGCLAAPLGEPDEKGWQRVALCDGREGYTKSGFLGPYHVRPARSGEADMRAAVLEAALAYRGTHYRWGGKTPMGIDCSGLCSMAYLLCGVLLWRDAQIKEGYPLHEIPLEAVKPADLLFFPGHVAMYLGKGRYLHSTAFPGSDGVTVNSLRPEHADFRADLADRIAAVGSIF